MKWIFQTTGTIDHYNPKIHLGNQPVRVLHHMNLYMFQNTHPLFASELVKAFEENGISKTVDVIYENSRVKTPYIRAADKTIVLQETFLSYLWCVIHSVYAIYIQTIDYPKQNKKLGIKFYREESEIIEKAQELFAYAKSLIAHHSAWDKDNLPNPERYNAERKDYIEQPNFLYTEAVKFIMCHEFIHGINHIDELNSGRIIDTSSFIAFEKEADHNEVPPFLRTA